MRSHALTTRFRDLELDQRRVAAEMAAIIADGEPRNIAALDDHHSMRGWRKANANRSNGHAARARNPAKALEALPEVDEALLVDIVVDQRTFEEELARRRLIPEPTDLRDVDLSERRCETTNGTAGCAVVATTGPTSQGHRQATPPRNTATAWSCTTGVTAPRCCPPVDATPTHCPTAQDWSTSPTSTNSLASPRPESLRSAPPPESLAYARRMAPRNLDDVFASFEQTWEPRIVARVNDYDVRVAKVDGEHTWHSHADTDEFFVVLAGRFTIDLRDTDPVVLGPGDTYVVPRGVEHRPRAEPGTRILMFEPSGTPSTGDQGPVDRVPSTTGIELT